MILVIGDRVASNGLWLKALTSMNVSPLEVVYTDVKDVAANVERYKPIVLMPLEWPRKGNRNGAIAATLRNAGMLIDDCQCYVEDSIYGMPAIPSYHPSFLAYNKKLIVSLYYALAKATSIARGEALPCVEDKILIDPLLQEVRDYLDAGLVDGRYPLLVGDIETPFSDKKLGGVEGEDRLYDTGQGFPGSYTIYRVGLSHTRNTAITVPWQPPYIECIVAAIKRADLFVEHADNHYDYRRLKANGCIFTGKIASSMWLWHWYKSDLLKELGFCAPFFFNGPAWKHLASSEPALYNGKDVCREFDVWEGCVKALAKEGRLTSFWEHCVEVDEILMKIGRIRLDVEKKDVFMSRLRAEALEKERELIAFAPAGAKKVCVRHKAPLPGSHGWREETYIKQLKRGPVEKKKWVREELNVGSHLQVKELIRALDLKVPTKKGEDGGAQETTGAKQLKRLAKKAPLLHTVLQIRSRRKMVEAYDWQPDPDGYVRTFYGFNPSTLRTSSHHYNLQVIPNRADLADEFRGALVASPGCLLGEVDSSGIEAVLVGYFAGSERYIRLAKAGVHGWLVSAYLGEPIPLDAPFDELSARCKGFKKSHKHLYNVCKPIIHGGNYRESAYGVYEQNPDHFSSEKEAKELLDLYFSTEPGKDVRKWQESTLQLAARQRYLQNPFGYKHEFYDVFKWNGTENVPSTDEKRAIAFLPQSTAAAIQRWYMLQLKKWNPEIHEFLRLITHDSKTIEYPEEMGTLPVEQLATIMKQPIPPLGGLAIGVEGKCGYNLRDMKVVV